MHDHVITPWNPNHWAMDPSTGEFLLKEMYADKYYEVAGQYYPIEAVDSSTGNDSGSGGGFGPIDPSVNPDPSTGDDNGEYKENEGEENP